MRTTTTLPIRDHNLESCMPAKEGLAYISLPRCGSKLPRSSASDFRFWAQFIQKSVNHRVMQFHFNPYHSSATLPWIIFFIFANCKNEEVAVTISVAEAVLCFSARVCKQQRELERICKGLPKKKPNTAVIGPARSLGTQWDCQRDQQLLHSGIMQCLSIHPLIGQICNLAEQCGVTTYRYSKVSFLNYNVGCMEGENNTSCTAEWNWKLFFYFYFYFLFFILPCMWTYYNCFIEAGSVTFKFAEQDYSVK